MNNYNGKKLFIFGEYRQSGFPRGPLCCTISVSSSFLPVFYYYAERPLLCPFLVKRDEKHSQQFARISAGRTSVACKLLKLYSYLNNTQIHSSTVITVADREWTKPQRKTALKVAKLFWSEKYCSKKKREAEVRLNNYPSINKSVKGNSNFRQNRLLYIKIHKSLHWKISLGISDILGLLEFHFSINMNESTFLHKNVLFAAIFLELLLKIYRLHLTLTLPILA